MNGKKPFPNPNPSNLKKKIRLPQYNSPTLLLSLGVSLRVLARLVARRPDVIHVSAPGMMVFAVILYARLLRIPLVVSYHTHIPE